MRKLSEMEYNDLLQVYGAIGFMGGFCGDKDTSKTIYIVGNECYLIDNDDTMNINWALNEQAKESQDYFEQLEDFRL